MILLKRAEGNAKRVGLLPAAFNPPTNAHLALAFAALEHVDPVIFVLPRQFPHKSYAWATFEQRIAMVRCLANIDHRFGAAISEGGLFLEIAREARQVYPAAEPWFICGRDAAERIETWDYGNAGTFDRMLDEFGLLVAPRGGAYAASSERVRELCIPGHDQLSSTQVRDRIRRGAAWEHLVPQELIDLVRSIHGPA